MLAVRLRALHVAEVLGLWTAAGRPPLTDVASGGAADAAWHVALAEDVGSLARAVAPPGGGTAALPPAPRVRRALEVLTTAPGPHPGTSLGLGLDRLVADPGAVADGGDRTARRRLGAYYTPPALADLLVGLGMASHTGARPPRTVDPACGTGALLLAALDHLAPDTGDRAARAGALGALLGVDVDPLAVEVSRLALWLAVGDPALPLAAVASRVRHADALAGPTPAALDAAGIPDDPEGVARWARSQGLGHRPVQAWHHLLAEAWPDLADPADGVDLVIGNPPFRSPLARTTAAGRPPAVVLEQQLGAGLSPYADDAWLFLALAWTLVAPDGGTVALVQPASLLGARDAAPIRRRLVTEGRVQALWLDDGTAFDAGIHTCAVVARRGSSGRRRQRVQRTVGLPPRRLAPVGPPADGDATWGHLAAGAAGVPRVDLPPVAGVLGDEAEVVVDFRDRYYALAGHVADAPTADPTALDADWAAVVTAGLLDPADLAWGRRPARLHGRRWTAPAVRLDELDPHGELARWVRRRRVPKVLVAQQTRVIEAVADPGGGLLPSVPVLSVVTPPARCWHVAAALLGPPASAWAAGRAMGTGRTAGVVRLRPADVRALPLPTDPAAWDEGARLVARAQDRATAADWAGWRRAMAALGPAMAAAHGLDDPALVAWWLDRLPDPSRGGA